MDTIGIDVKSFLEQFAKDNDIKKMVDDEVAKRAAENKAMGEKHFEGFARLGAIPRIVKAFCMKALEETIVANNKKIYEDLKSKGII